MFNPPYDYMLNQYFRQIAMFSYLRLLHASPDAPAVDVYANKTVIAKNLSYKNFTQYLPIQPGNYQIKIFPAGTTDNPVLTTDVQIPAYSIYTLAAVNMVENLDILEIPDPPTQSVPGMVNLRFVHLSPNAPNVDVRLYDGRMLFTDVEYKEATNYLSLPPSTYIFQFFITGTNQQVLFVPNINLMPDRFYTIYVVGLAGDTPPLQALIPLDGNSYIKF